MPYDMAQQNALFDPGYGATSVSTSLIAAEQIFQGEPTLYINDECLAMKALTK